MKLHEVTGRIVAGTVLFLVVTVVALQSPLTQTSRQFLGATSPDCSAVCPACGPGEVPACTGIPDAQGCACGPAAAASSSISNPNGTPCDTFGDLWQCAPDGTGCACPLPPALTCYYCAPSEQGFEANSCTQTTIPQDPSMPPKNCSYFGYGDSCPSQCAPSTGAYCGNGKIDPGEQCDDGAQNGVIPTDLSKTWCKSDCTRPKCSNGTDDDGDNLIDAGDPGCHAADCATCDVLQTEYLAGKDDEWNPCEITGDPATDGGATAGGGSTSSTGGNPIAQFFQSLLHGQSLLAVADGQTCNRPLPDNSVTCGPNKPCPAVPGAAVEPTCMGNGVCTSPPGQYDCEDGSYCRAAPPYNTPNYKCKACHNTGHDINNGVPNDDTCGSDYDCCDAKEYGGNVICLRTDPNSTIGHCTTGGSRPACGTSNTPGGGGGGGPAGGVGGLIAGGAGGGAGGAVGGGAGGATGGATGGGTNGGTGVGTTAGATAGTTAGTTAGNTAGNTSGTTSGQTSGTTAGNTAGTTAGNTAGNTAGGGGNSSTTNAVTQSSASSAGGSCQWFLKYFAGCSDPICCPNNQWQCGACTTGSSSARSKSSGSVDSSGMRSSVASAKTSSTASSKSSQPSYCGDGAVQNPDAFGVSEQCDNGGATWNGTNFPQYKYADGPGIPSKDGTNSNYGACSRQCLRTTCGDGIIQSPNGQGIAEQCDNGSMNGKDGKCTNDCRLVTSSSTSSRSSVSSSRSSSSASSTSSSGGSSSRHSSSASSSRASVSNTCNGNECVTADGNAFCNAQGMVCAPLSGLPCIQCIPAHSSSSAQSCNSTLDCPSGQICTNHQCHPASSSSSGFCNSTLDCPSGQICTNHQCHPASSSSSGFCNSTLDCPNGLFCINHQCQPPTSSSASSRCQFNTDCPNGQLCVQGQCKGSSSSARSCGTNNDCPAGQTCVNNVCGVHSSSSRSAGYCCVNGRTIQSASCVLTQSQATAYCNGSHSSIGIIGYGSSANACDGSECGAGGNDFCAGQSLTCQTIPGIPCIRCVPLTISAASQSSIAQLCATNADCAAGEQCIRNTCLTSQQLIDMPMLCGNGRIDPAEECDHGAQNGKDGKCDQNCQALAGNCGDGIIEHLLGEQCEPSITSNLPCSATCRFTLKFCGNGILDPGEQCDDGPNNSNGPNAHCRADCSFGRCGDGIVDTPLETCDDGNNVNGDGCSAVCHIETAAPSVLPGAVVSIPLLPQDQSQIGGSSYQLPPVSSHPPVGKTGPATLAIMAAGASAGYAFVRRKKKK